MTQKYIEQLFRKPGCGTASHSWTERHREAVRNPRGFEVAFVTLLSGWLQYADLHGKAYENGIGDDGVLGPEWAALGKAMRGLLNGSLGRLDGGTLDALITETLRAEGFDPDIL